jgi:thymidine phosphorylase
MVKKISKQDALKTITDIVNNGKAAEKFEQMVCALGGPKDILTSYKSHLQKAPYINQVSSNKKGFVQFIQTRNLGLILIELGGGRKQINDKIDFSVGYENVVDVGTAIDSSTSLVTVHTKSQDDYERVREHIESCFEINEDKVNKLTTIYKKMN